MVLFDGTIAETKLKAQHSHLYFAIVLINKNN